LVRPERERVRTRSRCRRGVNEDIAAYNNRGRSRGKCGAIHRCSAELTRARVVKNQADTEIARNRHCERVAIANALLCRRLGAVKVIAVLAAPAGATSATVAPEATSTAAAAKQPRREIRNIGASLRGDLSNTESEAEFSARRPDQYRSLSSNLPFR
jgi:hypothetical protein